MAAEAGGTIAKGLALLRTVSTFPHGATAAEVAALAQHPFSTSYRLLNTLVETGFVEFDPRTKLYSLGLPVFELGQRVANARGYGGTAAPVLEALRDLTQESCILAVRDGVETVTVHTVDGPQFRTTTDPGDRGRLHTSAVGKMLLAGLPLAERTQLVSRLELVPLTPHTVTDPDVLLSQLAVAADQGWVGQSEEQDLGMNAIAVPVAREGGQMLASLAIAAPVFRADLDTLVGHLPALREAAARLALTLP